MTLTGVDIPISQLREAFAKDLWTHVSNRIFYSKAFRNTRDGNIIAEVINVDNTYKEVHFNNKFNVQCFFDIGNDIDSLDEDLVSKASVKSIFTVDVGKIYDGSSISFPDLGYRATEEIHRDVIQIYRQFPEYSDISIDLNETAYGDLFADNMTTADMAPWHTFAVSASVDIVYDCGSEQDLTYPYPAPIIL